MPVTNDQVFEILRSVNDPELHRDIVTLNMVKNVRIDGAVVHIHVELTTPACPMKDQIRNDVQAAVTAMEGVDQVGLARAVRADNGDVFACADGQVDATQGQFRVARIGEDDVLELNLAFEGRQCLGVGGFRLDGLIQ